MTTTKSGLRLVCICINRNIYIYTERERDRPKWNLVVFFQIGGNCHHPVVKKADDSQLFRSSERKHGAKHSLVPELFRSKARSEALSIVLGEVMLTCFLKLKKKQNSHKQGDVEISNFLPYLPPGWSCH